MGQDFTKSHNMLTVNLLQGFDLSQSRVGNAVLQPLQSYLHSAFIDRITLNLVVKQRNIYDNWYISCARMDCASLQLILYLLRQSENMTFWNSEMSRFEQIFFQFIFKAMCLQCFDTVGWASGSAVHPTCKNWVMRCWCSYLSGARCRSFAYGPADATACQNPIISCLI